MENNADIRYSAVPLEGVRILSCYGHHNFPKHLHDGYVLWLNSHSGESYSVKGSTHLLQPGSISIIEPGMIHTNHSVGRHSSHLQSFYLSEKRVQDLHKTITQNESVHFFGTTEIRDMTLWQDLIVLHNRLQTATEKLEMDSCILTVFTEIFKRLGHTTPRSETSGSSRIARIKEYMSAHLANSITLEEIAEEAGCSTFHLIRIFRDTMHITPHAYLVQLRLERARHHLDQGKSIADATYLAGFTDQCHLTRRFKIRYGITPGKYVQQSRR